MLNCICKLLLRGKYGRKHLRHMIIVAIPFQFVTSLNRSLPQHSHKNVHRVTAISCPHKPAAKVQSMSLCVMWPKGNMGLKALTWTHTSSHTDACSVLWPRHHEKGKHSHGHTQTLTQTASYKEGARTHLQKHVIALT